MAKVLGIGGSNFVLSCVDMGNSVLKLEYLLTNNFI